MKARPPAMRGRADHVLRRVLPLDGDVLAVEHPVGVELGQLLDDLALRGDGIGGHHVGAAEHGRPGRRAVPGDDLGLRLGRDGRHRQGGARAPPPLSQTTLIEASFRGHDDRVLGAFLGAHAAALAVVHVGRVVDAVLVVHDALDGAEDVAEPAGVALLLDEHRPLGAPVPGVEAEQFAAGDGPAGLGLEDLLCGPGPSGRVVACRGFAAGGVSRAALGGAAACCGAGLAVALYHVITCTSS